MVTLEYEPHLADPVRDGGMSNEMYRIKHFASDPTCDITLQFSTDNIFYMTRLAIARGEIYYKNIFFKYQGHLIPLDEWGQYDDSDTVGFIGVSDRINELILIQIMKIGPR